MGKIASYSKFPFQWGHEGWFGYVLRDHSFPKMCFAVGHRQRMADFPENSGKKDDQFVFVFIPTTTVGLTTDGSCWSSNEQRPEPTQLDAYRHNSRPGPPLPLPRLSAPFEIHRRFLTNADHGKFGYLRWAGPVFVHTLPGKHTWTTDGDANRIHWKGWTEQNWHFFGKSRCRACERHY